MAVRLVKECIGKEAKGLSTKRRLGRHTPASSHARRSGSAKMEVRAVKIKDCTTRAAFEIYASLALGTPHNDFCEN